MEARGVRDSPRAADDDVAGVAGCQAVADVAIIGAGVVGAAIARALSRYRLGTWLVEKEPDVCGGASKANSGIVHSGVHSPPGSLEADLCVAGNRQFDALASELSVPFRRNGAVIVAKSPREQDELERLRLQGIRNRVPGMWIADRGQLLRLEPNLSPACTAALVTPSSGIVCPAELTFALVENAAANGVRLMTSSPVTRVGRDPADGAWVLGTPALTLRASYVVNASGLSGDSISRMAGAGEFWLAPRKGEEYILDRDLGGMVQRTVFPVPTTVSKGILVIPTVHGNIMIGPNAVETRDRRDLATTAAGFREVLSAARSLVPCIGPESVISSFAGLRAACPERGFIIEASSEAPGFMNVCGIESPGLTAAPAIAEMVVSLLAEKGLRLRANPSFDPVRRRPARIRDLSVPEGRRLIAADPAYGRVVCRCETVSEGEIVEAVRRGVTTLDGVKHRTRAGMGRCQGGFCSPVVARIVARTLGVGVEDVTKKGSGSWFVLCRSKGLLDRPQ